MLIYATIAVHALRDDALMRGATRAIAFAA